MKAFWRLGPTNWKIWPQVFYHDVNVWTDKIIFETCLWSIFFAVLFIFNDNNQVGKFFKDVLENEALSKTPIILILNKLDDFEEKFNEEKSREEWRRLTQGLQEKNKILWVYFQILSVYFLVYFLILSVYFSVYFLILNVYFSVYSPSTLILSDFEPFIGSGLKIAWGRWIRQRREKSTLSERKQKTPSSCSRFLYKWSASSLGVPKVSTIMPAKWGLAPYSHM